MDESREPEVRGLERQGAPARPEGRARLLAARIACIVGIICAAGSILAPLAGGSPNISGGALGAGLGIVGYLLGSRRLATATAVLGMAAIFFALAAIQGLVPGIALGGDG